jgi:hypothetical protein
LPNAYDDGSCRTVFKTSQPVMIYLSSGTGAWEAAIVNRLSPSDKVLMVETGHFAILWRQMAARWGLEVDFILGDWRRGAAPATIEAKLAKDGSRAIKAVMVVLTAVLVPPGHDADAFRRIVLETYNMSLEAGLAKLAGKVFWIGHLSECNDLILVAALSGVGMGWPPPACRTAPGACRLEWHRSRVAARLEPLYESTFGPHTNPLRGPRGYGFDHDLIAISDTTSVRKERSTAIKIYLNKEVKTK